MRITTRWIVLALAAVAFVIVLRIVVRPYLHQRYVADLITRFSTTPDQQTANRLAKVLDRASVPREQGNRILELLLTPKLSVRDTYRGDRPVHASAAFPFQIHLSDMTYVMSEYFYAGDKRVPPGGSSEGANSFGGEVRILRFAQGLDANGSLVDVNKPGLYRASLRYAFALRGRHDKGIRYRCGFELPIQVRVVEPEEAEKVALKSSSQLDRAMRAAFSSEVISFTTTYSTPFGVCEATPGVKIHCSSLLENVAFKPSFSDDSGVTIPFESFIVRQRAGTSGEIHVPLYELKLGPGTHTGKLILRADEAAAYPDPAIKTIWGGTLEFPMTVHVRRVGEKP